MTKMPTKNKKDTVNIYSYSELCEFFNENKVSNSRQREQQINRWRRSCNLVKIEGTYKYKMIGKPKSFQAPMTKRVTYADLLEPMILSIFLQKDTKHLAITQQELQEDLGFVNDNFRTVTWDFDLREIVAKKLGIEPSELSKYRTELYNLNKDAINSVIKHMVKLGVLFSDRTYKITYNDGTVGYADDDLKTSILEYRNRVSQLMANGLLYNQVKDEYLSKKILENVNNHFGFKSHYNAMLLHLDIDSIKHYVEMNYIHYNTYEEAKIEVNNRTQEKAVKSKRGELKKLPIDKKKKLVKELVDLDVDK